MSDNPYSSPEAEIVAHEINLRGGYFASGDAHPLHCTSATLSKSGGSLRLAFVPPRCLPAALVIYAALTALMIPFSVVMGVVGLVVYLLVYSMFCVAKIRNVEFSLEDETFILDRQRRRLGLCKRLGGKDYFLGLSTKGELADHIVELLPSVTEGRIKKRGRWKYHLTAVLIWFGGGLIAQLVHAN